MLLLLLLLLVAVQARLLLLLMLRQVVAPVAVALLLLLLVVHLWLLLLLLLRGRRRLADRRVGQRPDLWLGGRDGNSGLGVVVDVRLGARGGEAGGERARPVEGRGRPGQVAAVQRVVDSVQAQVVV